MNYDCLNLILDFSIKIPKNGETYKNLLFTSKYISQYYKKNHNKIVDNFSDHLLTLIKKFPDKNWDWKTILLNNIDDWDRILSLVDRQTLLKVKRIIVNINIDVNTLKNYNKRKIETILKDEKCNYYILSRHKSLTREIVLNHLSESWDMRYLVQKIPYLGIRNQLGFLSLESLVTNGEEAKGLNYFQMSNLSLNPNITWRFVVKYHDLGWNFSALSQNLFNKYI